MKRWMAVLVMCLPAFGQATYKGGKYAGTGTYVAQGQGSMGAGENFYCPAGTGELTEGTPTWGSSDGVALLPTRCMNTAMSSTPSGTHLDNSSASTFTPATNVFLQNVLGSANGGAGVLASGGTGGTLHLQCGDTIVLNAGSTYTGPFNFPALSCNGAHWTIVRTSGTADPNFPAEGVRATPCISGIANDAFHGRGLPGYPDYTCASYGSTLSAKITVAVTTGSPVTFTSGADHYRFIGIEVTKNSGVQVQASLIPLSSDNLTLGANHIIWDRSFIHGEPWTPASGVGSETPNGIRAANSQWIALINSWVVDTYCIVGCSDSHDFSFGTGSYQDSPFKIENNLLATAGEQVFSGGGGNSVAGTAVPKDIEIRANYIMKPLVWMAPIDSCTHVIQANGQPTLNTVVTKNLSEMKNATFVLYEGNYAANSWQGCQSDQLGVAFASNPTNQHNSQSMAARFDGTSTVVSSLGTSNWSSGTTYNNNDLINYNGLGYKSKQGSNVGHQPDTSSSWWLLNEFLHHGDTPDNPYCIIGGCVLAIADATRADQGVEYRFCNGTNGCTQAGMDLTIQARIVPPPVLPPAGTAQVNACVPGDCPLCKVENITYRFNEVYNVTNGIHITSGKDSICHDEGAGSDHMVAHDNFIHGISNEMSNGSTAQIGADGHAIASNTTLPIQNIELSHETIGNELGGGMGSQVDRSDLSYMPGINIHDNVSAAGWEVHNSSGSVPSAGVNADGTINNSPGLVNLYQIDSCRAYYPVEAPGGIVASSQHSIFTFAPALSLYFVTINGKPKAINSGFTTTGFTLTSAASDGDAITVRDMNSCDWTFKNNLLGTGLAGSGANMVPYPTSNNTNCGVSGTLDCILAPPNFVNLFGSYGTGRTGDFTLTGSNAAGYVGAASDAATRPPTGLNPGADFTILGQLLSGVAGTVYYPALSITTTTINGTVDQPLQAPLQASAGASPYKGWFLETNPANCGGNCGTLAPGIVIGRGGDVNGPFWLQTQGSSASITSNVAKIQLKQSMVAGANSWTAGQKVTLAGFCVDPSNPCTGTQVDDASFNGVWAVTASGANCTNTSSVVCLSITHADIAGHTPNYKGVNNPTVTFAPTTAGTFTWWMGVRDGAFQSARAAVTLTVGSQGGQNHQVDLNWNASLSSSQNGCCTYNLYRSVDPAIYGPASATQVSGTTFTDTTVMSGTTYYYVVTAFDGTSESAYSNEAVAVVP